MPPNKIDMAYPSFDAPLSSLATAIGGAGITLPSADFSAPSANIADVQFAPISSGINVEVFRDITMDVPVTKSNDSRRLFTVLAVLVFIFLAIGVIGPVIFPSRNMIFGIPVGFTLWALLAWMIAREERPQSNDG
jgi:hypothetical protein